MQLMRIAQEALANVRKHAHASRVLVQLRREAAGWGLIVRDDGAGFDPQAALGTASRHFGLAIMRERAEGLGGTLHIEAAPGAGTTVTAHIPSQPAPTAADTLTAEGAVSRAAGGTSSAGHTGGKEEERGASAALAG
jgi:two-component system nitrate/nitrite sensor histidine kinase NarX